MTPSAIALQKLIDVLTLAPKGSDEFEGESQNLGMTRVFGGQVLAQALMAAYQTVDDRVAHSLHAYFIRLGDPKESIRYQVKNMRDGRSFSNREVIALQKNRAIFSMVVSFQSEENGLDYQGQLPDVTPPEQLESELERAKKIVDQLPPSLKHKATRARSIEVKAVDPIDYLNPQKREPVHRAWVRAVDKLSNDYRLHQALLAYTSDIGLIEPALFPHGITFLDKRLQVASLDHSMWFHQRFEIDEWLLYDLVSPRTSQCRGLSFGKFFDRNGRHVASTAQEGLIRIKS